MSRAKTPAPEHYYEEYLYKKDKNDRGFTKLWAGILGNTLCFYSNHKDLRSIDTISLENYVSLKEPGGNLSSENQFSLCMKGREIQLKAESLESREMWRAYIITIAELRIPPSLSLLPGPRLALKEALEKEIERKKKNEAEENETPSCFYNVSRMEAENLLMQNRECGNLLLRPGGNQKTLSVSTCQKFHSKDVVKHYRVMQEQEGYVIQVEPKVVCSSLANVISHFVNSSNKTLKPFVKICEYENKIAIYEQNNEDGVVTVRYAQDSPVINIYPFIGSTKTSPLHTAPPPLPRDPPPEDDYENPDQGEKRWNSFREVSKGPRTPKPVPSSGLDEELRRKLEIRRQQIN
ncbi:signal-transducing adaptor protein 2 isoform X1 [Xenopus tropicalis]|uniref:Signal-transducing adaptor protein 2 isoform X1 n=1 Tax=Xenopus tropicalis TaxID=8364 RepID=A0A8J0SDJ6_XENTR|nr:signal-transducing adaptor protein 2 isoform X1 [Xenopus tropicalis]XP_012810384.1 signal-transducing adaptor protein 2 isoform X1 [Xenopus tropicalis]|eukprot:XP_012810379.1 PREDICTED: signal-transducing adaptor protein 2 isoform X1 [Xenopus tropicalis]